MGLVWALPIAPLVLGSSRDDERAAGRCAGVLARRLDRAARCRRCFARLGRAGRDRRWSSPPALRRPTRRTESRMIRARGQRRAARPCIARAIDRLVATRRRVARDQGDAHAALGVRALVVVEAALGAVGLLDARTTLIGAGGARPSAVASRWRAGGRALRRRRASR